MARSPLGRLVTLQELRRDVLSSPYERIGTFFCARMCVSKQRRANEQLTTVFEDLPCSEISNLYPKLAVKKEILRFEVSDRGGFE